MELIEDHGTDVGQRAVILEPAQQDAFGDKTDAGADAGVIVEADLIADLRAEFSLALPGDAGGHGAGGDAAGLQHHDHLVARDPRIEQHLRHLRGLARARGRDEHQAIAGLQRAQDVGVDFPDGERGGGGHEAGRARYRPLRGMKTRKGELDSGPHMVFPSAVTQKRVLRDFFDAWPRAQVKSRFRF